MTKSSLNRSVISLLEGKRRKENSQTYSCLFKNPCPLINCSLSHVQTTTTSKQKLIMPGSFNCSDPDSVTNGYYLFDKSTYGDGDQVYFICYDGYSMNGSPVLTCDGATGNWTGNAPICSSTTTTLTTTTAATQGLSLIHI